MRISRDQSLMLAAHVAALRGTCQRLSVGAVLAYGNRPLSNGYNGPPSGEPHCWEAKCDLSQPCGRSTHAEKNAIMWALAYGMRVKGATLYITDSPCQPCAEFIVKNKISRVVYDREYRKTGPLDYLRENGVEVVRCPIDPAISATFASMLPTPASRG